MIAEDQPRAAEARARRPRVLAGREQVMSLLNFLGGSDSDRAACGGPVRGPAAGRAGVRGDPPVRLAGGSCRGSRRRLVIAAGAISVDGTRAEAQQLGPVIGFLAAVLVLARLCDDEGLFDACGAWMARAAAGRPRRLLAAVFVAASAVTAVLSLDATVVLLTPVVFATAARLGARAKPHVYAAAHLSNTASLAAAGLQPDQPAGVRC